MQRIRAAIARRGMALPTALGAIVIIGVMVSGVFYMSTQELRASTGGVAQERAFRAAEYGLNRVMGEWNNTAMGLQPVGTHTVRTFSGTKWVDTVHITKLGPYLYSLVSTGTVDAGVLGKARRTTGLSVRTIALDINANSALTVRGDAKIGGSSFISGYDWNPTNWGDCAPAGVAKAGLMVANSNNVQLSGCSNLTCLEGSPKVSVNAAAADTSTYFSFGDYSWTELTSMATHTFPGSSTLTNMAPSLTASGECNSGQLMNWGEPWRTLPPHPCQSHFPIIHFKGPGTVTLSTGRGQGILLVDGDLKVAGNFEFFGPVIVRGRLETVGTSGNKLNGAVMAANVQLEQNSVLGDATIRYSKCALTQAMQAAASPRRLTQRAWTEAF